MPLQVLLSPHLNSVFFRCFVNVNVSFFLQRMSVKNIWRRSSDVDRNSPQSRIVKNLSSVNSERPISEYDNITTTPVTRTDFPLAGIQFRFTDSPLQSGMSSNAMHRNNEDQTQTTTLPAHKYENVLETLQMRNKQESDQQVKTNHVDGPRSVMSDARNNFFGLNTSQQSNMEDDLNRLIEDIGNAKIVSSDRVQYENIDESKVQSNQDKVSPTSSKSGSSSTTVTPSESPTRQERPRSTRKSSEGSNRSKSPKFMLPEVSPSSPSQVKYLLHDRE